VGKSSVEIKEVEMVTLPKKQLEMMLDNSILETIVGSPGKRSRTAVYSLVALWFWIVTIFIIVYA
jgi:hypothetical protein